ncbi:MAG: Nramp family divalent metal transporter [Chloroflexi bacterium]|nr:Nramp family divalent metal transporter [Chloroflexota bacterium]
MPLIRRFRRRRLMALLAALGPGIIAALAGDDAGGIGTYSIAGAAYGYDLLWALLIVGLALAVVQETCARMGVVTGKGLSDLIREEFGVRTTALAMSALLIANAAVTVSEFVGIAVAGELFGISPYLSVPLAAILVWLVVTRGNYQRAEKFYLALTLIFLTYFISVFVIAPDWLAVVRGSLVPSFRADTRYLLIVIALIGTTISPYMQFSLQAIIADKGIKPDEYALARADTLIGVVLTIAVAFFIIVATGATLHAQGIRDVETAEQAALALAPIAVQFAERLFALGLLGASLLAASILPLTSAYAVCEAFGWERGLQQEWDDAPVFYGLYTGIIIVGAALALIPGVPLFQLLLLAYDVNGILLPIILVLMLRLANNRRLMGRYANGRIANGFAYGTAVVLIILTALLLVSSLLGLVPD